MVMTITVIDITILIFTTQNTVYQINKNKFMNNSWIIDGNLCF